MGLSWNGKFEEGWFDDEFQFEVWIVDSNGSVDLIWTLDFHLKYMDCEFEVRGLDFEGMLDFWRDIRILNGGFLSFEIGSWFELMASWNLKFKIWILDSNGIVDLICEFRILGVQVLKFEVIFGFEWSNLKFGSCLMGLSWNLTFEGVLVSWWFEFGIEILDLIGEFRI
jgi:hypothetical protein